MKNEDYQIKAVEQWTRMLPLTAKRGNIIDTNGNILAYSTTSYDVYVRAKEVDKPTDLARLLSEKLKIDFDIAYKKVQDVYTSESLIKLNINEDLALSLLKENYNGLYITENISRKYPYDNLLAQVLGYLTSDSIGQTGIESYYDKILAGTDGKYLTQSDVRGVKIDDSLNYYVDAIDGLDISLSIDINLQNILEEVLEQIIIDHNPKKVSAILMDPSSSQILALNILPDFNLNNIPRDNVSLLMELTKNSVVSDVYEPGSTFKILTLAAALSEGVTNESEKFYCPGYRIVDGEKIKCWKTTGHGSQTLAECVQNSCNCCFIDLALRLGKEKLYSHLKSFGVGSLTGVDVSGESSGLMIDSNLVQTVDLARIGFGQSVAVTQLQLINSFCSVINGGTLHSPSIVKNYSNGTDILYTKQNLILNHNVDEKTSKTLRYLLEMSLSKTGIKSFVQGYSVAGKTGTAQKYGENGAIVSGKYVSSFFGFLNENDNPTYALLLCVDEPSSGAYYGGVVAKPYAKIIFEKILEYENKEIVETSLETMIIPELVGLSVSKAIAILDRLNVNYDVAGEGLTVSYQYPFADSVVSRSTSIVIELK